MLIELDRLHAHPDNPNRMGPAVRARLREHLARSGRCPPLIVRPHPRQPDAYEILDGHHRAELLRELHHRAANCEVWEADDAQAALLLATLNRLHGEDDPRRRGALLDRLRQSMDVTELRELVPESKQKLAALLALAHAPPRLAPPPRLQNMPEPITFFITARQKARLLEHLRQIDPSNPSAALVRLLALDAPSGAEA